jgi:integrase
VNLKAGTLVLRDTKNGEDHVVMINATTRALLESLPKPVSKSRHVFPRVLKMRFRREWRRACRAARIGTECACGGKPLVSKHGKKCPACRSTGIVPDFRFHDLRHQGATDLIERGATLYDVQDFLGHKPPTMTQRYAHMVEARRRQTAKLLDQPVPGRQDAANG